MGKIRIALSLLFLAVTTQNSFAIETHCDSEERIIFNCKLVDSMKIVSVCKVGPEPLEAQNLQYRFGAPGKLELVFPKQGFFKKQQFLYERQYSNNAGYLLYELTFSIGRNKYNIYWEEVNESDDAGNWERTRIANGINVTTSGGKSRNLLCDKNAVNNFIPADLLYNVIRDEQ